MTTALDTISGALRLLGVQSASQPVSANDAVTGLTVLNELIETLSLQNLTVYSQQVQTFTTVVNVASYTLGPTGAWSGVRSTSIDQMWVTYQGVDFQLTEYENARFNAIPLKTQTGVLPLVFAYDGSVSNGVVTLWPVPSIALPINIAANRQLTQIASTTTTLVLPPGYARMLRLMLARELQSEYGVQLSPVTLQMANQALGDVKRANLTPATAKFDAMYTNGGNGIGSTRLGYLA